MKITRAKNLKAKPDFSNLKFGRVFTDHMLKWEYDAEKGGWQEIEIVPYDNIAINPAACCLHYGQGIFEGMKAYKNKEGKITMFRPMDNFIRMNKSADRLCMPEFDSNVALEGLTELIKLEKDWIPDLPGTALYIRPVMFSTEEKLSVDPSQKYLFLIILSPVGSYYVNGLTPTKLIVEDVYTRASLGGTGECKCMGNYACSLLAGELAAKKGYDQVLWLDGEEKKYVTEVGAMNMAFVFDDKVVTPELDGSILRGITRDSMVKVCKHFNIPIEERKVPIQEVIDMYNSGRLKEAFGTGTAAVISPVGVIDYKETKMLVNDNKMGKITEWLYDRITGIQVGRYEDVFGWVYKVN